MAPARGEGGQNPCCEGHSQQQQSSRGSLCCFHPRHHARRALIIRATTPASRGRSGWHWAKVTSPWIWTCKKAVRVGMSPLLPALPAPLPGPAASQILFQLAIDGLEAKVQLLVLLCQLHQGADQQGRSPAGHRPPPARGRRAARQRAGLCQAAAAQGAPSLPHSDRPPPAAGHACCQRRHRGCQVQGCGHQLLHGGLGIAFGAKGFHGVSQDGIPIVFGAAHGVSGGKVPRDGKNRAASLPQPPRQSMLNACSKILAHKPKKRLECPFKNHSLRTDDHEYPVSALSPQRHPHPREPFHDGPLTRCMAGPGLVPTEQMAAYYGRRADIGLIISKPPSSVRTGRATPIPWALQRRTDRRLEESDQRRACQRRQDLRPAVARGPSLPPFFHHAEVLAPPPSPMRARCRACASWSIRCPAPDRERNRPAGRGLRPGRRQRHRGGL